MATGICNFETLLSRYNLFPRSDNLRKLLIVVAWVFVRCSRKEKKKDKPYFESTLG